jgi:DNA-binding beta-propeller fold protein YncE
MTLRAAATAGLVAAGLAGLAGLAAQAPRAPRAPLRLLTVTRLPGVHGRIDHFDVDLRGQRLFMSALGNNTVEVFDLRTARVVHTIGGLHEPQGVSYVPRSHLLFVANGGDGIVRIYDARTFALKRAVRFASDADDTRYDAARNEVLVGYGGQGDAGLAMLDASTGRLRATIPLPSHPESFQMTPGGGRIYVNIPTAGNVIAVVSRKQRRVVATWHIGGAAWNFPMALDARDHHLFIACRRPAEVLVIDTRTGAVVAKVACVSAADDLWWDGAERRAYVSGGGGSITVIAPAGAGWRATAFPTPAGGRTSLLVPQLGRLFLGVWGRGGRAEEMRVYAMQP